MAYVPTLYDALFQLLAGHQGVVVPPEYLKALAYSESRMNPANTTGNMWGLFQVNTAPGGVLDDYNAEHDRKVLAKDLFNPDTNTAVFLWYVVAKILPAYEATGIPNLQPDWNNAEFIRLLTAGWNSGPYGVVKVAKCVQAKGHLVTHENVFRYAEECGGPQTLWWNLPLPSGGVKENKKREWQTKVQKLYSWFREYKPLPPLETTTSPPSERSAAIELPTVTVQPKASPWLPIILLAALMYFLSD